MFWLLAAAAAAVTAVTAVVGVLEVRSGRKPLPPGARQDWGVHSATQTGRAMTGGYDADGRPS